MTFSIPAQAKTVSLSLLMALAAALMAVAFLTLTHWVFVWTFEVFSHQSALFFIGASLVTIVVSSLLVGLLLEWAGPMAAGSGIPQLKAAYWKETGVIPWKPVLIKFVAGVISIGGGASLGREGPTLFFGGGIASNLARLFRVPRHLRRAPSALGASAGLAAAFNTPLAAITFVLEEILGDMSSRALGGMIIASVIGAFVVYAFLGPQPAFLIPPINQVSWIMYSILPLVAVVTALIGVAFQRAILAWRNRIKKVKRIPKWLLPLFGGLTTWILGVPAFLAFGKLGVFGLGYQDLSDVLNNHFLWWVAGLLVVAKWLATVASYSFGGCGGIFSPLLFLGGMAGFFIAGLAAQLGVPLKPEDIMALAAMGMATCLGTVLRAPLSCLLIVFEMTHEFAMVPGLLLGLLVSTLLARLAGKHNFYDALLVQDGHLIHHIHPPTALHAWKAVAVGALANPNPVSLELGAESNWKSVADRYPFRVFPVVSEGVPQGVITRRALDAWRPGEPPPAVEPVVTCQPEDVLGDVESRFLETPAGLLLLVDNQDQLCGLLTLHDLLRAQAAIRD